MTGNNSGKGVAWEKHVQPVWNEDRAWSYSKKQDQKGHTDRDWALGNGLLSVQGTTLLNIVSNIT